ncbi:uncharacterized protein [Onthophagus taurus]|uniref:uncharacterized protein isoform X2 n=1 Tax=Onthophagus taurus TaxID=166361 RepID=UPI000C2027B5|nr:uncharacterized protein LOC111425966 isoform X2 [Onthophagus taurus]
MNNNYLSDVKTLIQDYKRIQQKNLNLVETLNEKMLEIKTLRDNELKMQNQIKEALENTLNVENITGKYMDMKEKYEKILDEKKISSDAFKKQEIEIVEKYEEQLRHYQDILAKEQEKFTQKENYYLNELKNVSSSLIKQVQECDMKWKGCLDDANRKLKESNLSCSTLRTQLVQANYRQRNNDLLEKKVRELENKLEQKEKDLAMARKVLYVKENYRLSPSPGRDLYKTNTKKGPYTFTKKSSSPHTCVDSPKSSSNDYLRPSLSMVSESVLEITAEKDDAFQLNDYKHKLQSSSESGPVKDKPKKRKLYDPTSAHLEYMMKPPEDHKK